MLVRVCASEGLVWWQVTSWQVYPDADADAGQIGESMAATDLDACQNFCISAGYGGFAVQNGTAHFRKTGVVALRRSLRGGVSSSTFYLAPQHVALVPFWEQSEALLSDDSAVSHMHTFIVHDSFQGCN